MLAFCQQRANAQGDGANSPVNPQPIMPMRAALLIFKQQLNNPFKLGQDEEPRKTSGI